MSFRGVRLLTIVSAGLLALSACTGDSGEAPDSTSTRTALDSFYDQEIVWGGCQSGQGECAGVEVPVDYDAPDGRTVSLNVRRIPAKGEAAGTLFFNPGGPGSSGVQALPWWARGLSDEVREHFDIVAFDPRGIAGSDGLRCAPSGTRQENRVPDQTPDSRAEEQRLIKWYRQIGRACIEFDPELARNMSTAEVARDLDVLRGVVGDDRLNYVGVSYGTEIGAHYADLFPDHVGRVVLDAAVDTAQPPSRLAKSQVRGHRTVLRAYLRDCVRKGCPLGATKRKAMSTLRGLLSNLDELPMSVDGRATLTENRARYAIEAALASGDWPSLTRALRAALDGDAAALYRLAVSWYGADPATSVANLEGNVTLCSDSRERLSVDDIRGLADELRRMSPVFGTQFAWAQVPCGQWPIEPPADKTPLEGAGADPIVVIGSRGDPLTPYQQAAAVAERLDSAVLLTARTYAHGAYAGIDRCIDKQVDAYLLEGETPDAGTEC